MRGARAALLIPYIAVSSFLGLTGRFFIADPADAWAFFTGVWSASVLADIVFVAGSAAAGAGAWLLARRRRRVVSIVVALAANALVYVVSWMTMVATHGSRVAGADVRGLAGFVLVAGSVGLVFAALAPAGAASFLARRTAAAGADADDPGPRGG